MAFEDIIAGGFLGGFLATLGIAFFVIIAALYVYSALALMYIAKRAKTPNSWLAWIPISNFYLITQTAKKSGLWTLILLAGFISFVGSIAIIAVTIWLFWLTVERIKFPGWTSLLILVPVVNLVMLGVWAWAKR